MTAPLIIFHGLPDALGALAAAEKLNRGIVLITAPGAAGYAGAGWFLEIVAQAQARYPHAEVRAVLDCGQDAGTALGAIRAGVKTIRFSGTGPVREKVAMIATSQGVGLFEDESRGLDLQFAHDAEDACLAWINKNHDGQPEHKE